MLLWWRSFLRRHASWVRHLASREVPHRSLFTMVAASPASGVVAIASGLSARRCPPFSGEFSAGACSRRAGTQIALMVEQIPPEHLGRAGSYGTIVRRGCLGPRGPPFLRDCLSPLSSSALSDRGATACDGYAVARKRPKRGEKRYRADSIARYSKKRRQSSVHASALKPLRRRGIALISQHRASLFVANYHFRICWLAQGQNARAGNWAKAKIRRAIFFLHTVPAKGYH